MCVYLSLSDHDQRLAHTATTMTRQRIRIVYHVYVPAQGTRPKWIIYCTPIFIIVAIDFVQMPSISSSIYSKSTSELFFFAVKFVSFFLQFNFVYTPVWLRNQNAAKRGWSGVGWSKHWHAYYRPLLKSNAIRTKSNSHAAKKKNKSARSLFQFICLFSFISAAWTLKLNATMSASVTFAEWNAKTKIK